MALVVPETSTDKQRLGKLKSVKELFWEADWRDSDTIDAIAKVLGYTGDDIGAKRLDILNLLDEAWIPDNNRGAAERSRHVLNGQSTTVVGKLQCPIFNTHKCLPTNMKIKISLTKNNDDFLLLTKDEDYSIVLEDCRLEITYFKPPITTGT